MTKRLLAGLLGASFLAACATTGEAPRSAPASATPPAASAPVYPSTYRPYPGVVTAIVHANVFDGAGGRIETGPVILADGKVSAVGGPAKIGNAGCGEREGT